MFKFGRERTVKNPQSPVDKLLADIAELGDYPWQTDDYISRTRDYLSYAKSCGLSSQPIVDSCIDLAQTYSTIPEMQHMREQKTSAWLKSREEALRVEREPVEINMELDPVYFEAILHGRKIYEGRAYKPSSDKNYPDMRPGDMIRFRLSERDERFYDDATSRRLSYDMEMLCQVDDTLYAPTVHGVYQLPRFCGLGFQPMINGSSEALQLQRAAVYHTFPGYNELINEHGFIGIKVANPSLVAA